MLVSMSDKELKRLSVLQEICDQRITQSHAAQLLHISERQIRRLLQKYKAQGYELALPTYYRNAIYNEEEKEKLWLMKLDKEKRYTNKREVDVSKTYENYYKVLNEERKLNRQLGSLS